MGRRAGEPVLRAVDKKTGKEITRGGQYIVLSMAAPGHPAELVALAPPGPEAAP